MQLMKIEDVAQAVRQYRAQGVRAYPETVWERISELSRNHPLPEISRQIGISTHYLKQRLSSKPNRSRFCELKFEPPVDVRADRFSLVVRRRDGSELAVEAQGCVDICQAIAGFMRS